MVETPAAAPSAGSRPLIGPRIRPEAAGGAPHQAPWTVHSPSSTLGGPIEIPMGYVEFLCGILLLPKPPLAPSCTAQHLFLDDG